MHVAGDSRILRRNWRADRNITSTQGCPVWTLERLHAESAHVYRGCPAVCVQWQELSLQARHVTRRRIWQRDEVGVCGPRVHAETDRPALDLHLGRQLFKADRDSRVKVVDVNRQRLGDGRNVGRAGE